MKNIKLALILVIIVTVVSISISVLAQPTNDTWEDNHWGGDTGEETYSEPATPAPPPPSGGFDLCCGTSMIVIAPLGVFYFTRR